jgi:hypothetical protein
MKKIYKVKISYLPVNMTEYELNNLLIDWGSIGKIKLLNYDDYSNVYIDFNNEEEADYFVKALHKTPFDHEIINVEKIL